MSNIFPTAYLPSIEYVSLFLKTDDVSIELYETYQKQSCRTRCNVMTANGIQTLTIPVIKTNGNHTLTKDIEISYKEAWQQIHLRCLESAYRKSAYFDYYFPYFEKIYKQKFNTLIELNDYCLKTILKLLKVKKEYSYTEDFEKIVDDKDFRISLSKNNYNNFEMKPYYQVFADRHGFVSNLSIVDLLFNEGSNSMYNV
ncbi:MAG: WbqC family protein [Bacteroidales bacterium]|nr:WbqC family protein [Bacteroidales bacterium]